jgi:cell fate (sporulation/competence/biofilm development) regulator YlbF (YheA/YmcA/DUF963 family)
MKMTNTTAALPADVQEALEALTENLLHAEPIVAYHRARARLESDSAANDLLKCLSQAQADLRGRQARGAVTQADLDRVRTLQREAQSNRIVVDYAEAQQAANAYIPTVNQEISALLGVDFATLARSTCC